MSQWRGHIEISPLDVNGEKNLSRVFSMTEREDMSQKKYKYAEGVPERDCNFQIPMIQKTLVKRHITRDEFERTVTGYKCGLTGTATTKMIFGMDYSTAKNFLDCNTELCPQYQTMKLLKETS